MSQSESESRSGGFATPGCGGNVSFRFDLAWNRDFGASDTHNIINGCLWSSWLLVAFGKMLIHLPLHRILEIIAGLTIGSAIRTDRTRLAEVVHEAFRTSKAATCTVYHPTKAAEVV